MKVFYRHEQNALTKSFSPSASKPGKVVDRWLENGLIDQSDIQSFPPLTTDDLKLAHDPDYVDGVFDGFELNGFENTDASVAESTLFTCGSLYHAAKHALAEKTHVCSPTSGFHHAHFDRAEGFCTFNGLMVTAIKLKQQGLINTVSIIDCDMHYGNGTQDIIDHMDLDWVQHHTAGRHFHDRTDDIGMKFGKWLTKAVHESKKADLVIYQAGADQHLHDPLGGLLTSSQMIRRDMLVSNLLFNKPVVWNFAGGYQRDINGSIDPVIKLHTNTLKAFTNGYD